MVDRISPEEALRRVRKDGYAYVDVRAIPEFEQGHPVGAYNVPLMHIGAAGMEPNSDFVAVLSAWFPKHAKLILGCKSGGRSLRAAEMLEAAGWKHVVDQRAGWNGARDPFGRVSEKGWQAAGLPAATDPLPGRSYRELLVVR